MPQSILAKKSWNSRVIGTGNDQRLNRELKFADTGILAMCGHLPPGPEHWSDEESITYGDGTGKPSTTANSRTRGRLPE